MGTKMAVSFADISMAEVETNIINQSPYKPLIWKRYIDDIFSLWNINKEAINNFTELANSFHPTVKFTAEISDTEITFLDTCVYEDDRFKEHSILDVRTHFKSTETFQYMHFDSCHPPTVMYYEAVSRVDETNSMATSGTHQLKTRRSAESTRRKGSNHDKTNWEVDAKNSVHDETNRVE